jgi:hypothetical protein
MKKQVVGEGTLEVPEDVLHSRKMGLTGVMHVEAHMLDHIGIVRPGDGDV